MGFRTTSPLLATVSRADAARSHGRHVFAFLNIRTNQVLYSLTRQLDQASVKQLPDLGANNTPPSARRDHWRPFFEVRIPENNKSGSLQGLDLFRRLREWRILHETNWEPSPLLSRTTPPEEIEDWQKKLDDKGGSKSMTVYDLIKREKKKMRIRAVMDQKANSVADLAATLNWQDNHGKEILEQQSDRDRRDLLDILGKARQQQLGASAEIRAKIQAAKDDSSLSVKQRHATAAALNYEIREMKTCESALQSRGEAWAQRRRKLESQQTERAADIQNLRSQDPQDARLAGLEALNEEAKDDMHALSEALAYLQNTMNIPSTASATSGEGATAQPEIVFENIPKQFLREIATLRTAARPVTSAKKIRATKRRDHILSRPVYSTEGVLVNWYNILDAEFAEQWPSNVQHDQMEKSGASLFSAPPVEKVGDLVSPRDARSKYPSKKIKARTKVNPNVSKSKIYHVSRQLLRSIASTPELQQTVAEKGWVFPEPETQEEQEKQDSHDPKPIASEVV